MYRQTLNRFFSYIISTMHVYTRKATRNCHGHKSGVGRRLKTRAFIHSRPSRRARRSTTISNGSLSATSELSHAAAPTRKMYAECNFAESRSRQPAKEPCSCRRQFRRYNARAENLSDPFFKSTRDYLQILIGPLSREQTSVTKGASIRRE